MNHFPLFEPKIDVIFLLSSKQPEPNSQQPEQCSGSLMPSYGPDLKSTDFIIKETSNLYRWTLRRCLTSHCFQHLPLRSTLPNTCYKCYWICWWYNAHICHHDIHAENQLQPYLDNIFDWTRVNHLQLNPDKCAATLFTTDPGRLNTKLNLTSIKFSFLLKQIQ